MSFEKPHDKVGLLFQPSPRALLTKTICCVPSTMLAARTKVSFPPSHMKDLECTFCLHQKMESPTATTQLMYRCIRVVKGLLYKCDFDKEAKVFFHAQPY